MHHTEKTGIHRRTQSKETQVRRRLEMRKEENNNTSFNNSTLNNTTLNNISFVCSTPDKIRSETSLGALTKKFTQLLNSNQQRMCDINEAAESLGVQKRRIYDITNVLEGTGLVVKVSKNKVQWREPAEGCASMAAIKKNIEQLRVEESKLDRLIDTTTQQLQLNKSAFVTLEDVSQVMGEKLVIAIRAPPLTQVTTLDHQSHHKLSVTSSQGPIEAILVSKLNHASDCADVSDITGVADDLNNEDSGLMKSLNDVAYPPSDHPFASSPSHHPLSSSPSHHPLSSSPSHLPSPFPPPTPLFSPIKLEPHPNRHHHHQDQFDDDVLHDHLDDVLMNDFSESGVCDMFQPLFTA